MACSASLFPQIGTLRDHNNVFYVQGYSGFGEDFAHDVRPVSYTHLTLPTKA